MTRMKYMVLLRINHHLNVIPLCTMVNTVIRYYYYYICIIRCRYALFVKSEIYTRDCNERGNTRLENLIYAKLCRLIKIDKVIIVVIYI